MRLVCTCVSLSLVYDCVYVYVRVGECVLCGLNCVV